MKKTLKGILVAVIAVLLVFSLVSCGGGGNSPESLAKQTWAAYEKVKGNYRDGALGYLEWAMNDAETLNPKLYEKIKALSEEDMKLYNAELEKIGRENF